jgi:hypothetical protein
VLDVRGRLPRLLEFGNRSYYQTGLKGLIWRSLNLIDATRRDGAWIQVPPENPLRKCSRLIAVSIRSS